MRLAWWKRKLSARPGQGFGRNPSAGVTKRGLGLTVHFRARNSFQQRQLKKPRCLTIASAVILLPQSGGRRGRVREPHAESPCFAPHGGSKMTAPAIVDRPTYLPFQLPICGSKKKAGAIVNRPGNLKIPFPDRSAAPKCRAESNSRRNPRRWDPGQSLGRDAPLFLFHRQRRIFFPRKKMGGWLPSRPVGRHPSSPSQGGNVPVRHQAHIPPSRPVGRHSRRRPRPEPWAGRTPAAVHFALPVSRRMVSSVVEQGQCIRKTARSLPRWFSGPAVGDQHRPQRVQCRQARPACRRTCRS
jgi:hypothetical protein